MTVATPTESGTHRRRRRPRPRRGVIAVLAAVCLIVVFAFVAMGVDIGRMVNTQSRMQTAVDAAALAASQEITNVIWNAAENGGGVIYDQAVANARQTASSVAAKNGVYVDPERDVEFGSRYFDADTERWLVHWGIGPYNAVKVTARRTERDTSSPDGRLPLSFGWAVGVPSVPLETYANAFVEARDIVLVLDYSGSMNDDSELSSSLPLGEVEANLDDMWDELVYQDPKWPDTDISKFPATGFGAVNSYVGTHLTSDDTDTILHDLGLDQVDGNGSPLYPYPQGGKADDGTPNGPPGAAASQEEWRDYIDYVKGLSGPYNKKYGFRTLMDYLLVRQPRNNQSEDLWRTPHYPFHAMKEGVTLFTQFLEDIGYGDQLGLVTYDLTSRVETSLNENDAVVDLGDNPLTYDYEAIDTIQRHKQAYHYAGWTGMGYGIRDARQLLDDYGRCGAHGTILVMTDGRTNQRPGGWTLPADWDWNEVTDFDGDGTADYTTSNADYQYAFWEAQQAILAGYTIHTMTLGAGADDDLMQAMAKAGGGVWIDVPGGSTMAEMQEQATSAFGLIAAQVPPAKLFFEEVTGDGYGASSGACGSDDSDDTGGSDEGDTDKDKDGGKDKDAGEDKDEDKDKDVGKGEDEGKDKNVGEDKDKDKDAGDKDDDKDKDADEDKDESKDKDAGEDKDDDEDKDGDEDKDQSNGNDGHGNNVDGVDSSNTSSGQGGPNGAEDPSGDVDDEK